MGGARAEREDPKLVGALTDIAAIYQLLQFC
jgi:hypothetical protein